MVRHVVSGGQTGVDRAVLDVARELGLPCGGWCPNGRVAEDGAIPERYPLKETPSEQYAQRTEWNVRDSDGTLVLTIGEPTGGTAQTIACAVRMDKPHLVLDLSQQSMPETVLAWVTAHQMHVLNVAGPRESKHPGVYTKAVPFLRETLRLVSSCRASSTTR